MGTKLFVTHGRGLNTFAAQEISESIPNVCDIQSLGEGKLSFVIKHSPSGLHHGNIAKEDYCKAETGKNDELSDNLKYQEGDDFVNIVAPVFKLKMVERIFLLLHCEQICTDVLFGDSSKARSVDAEPSLDIVCSSVEESVAGLDSEQMGGKVSDCEMSDCKKPFSESSRCRKAILKEYKTKLVEVMKNIEWTSVARRVRMIKKYQENTMGTHALCSNPSTCPGSLNRKYNREQLQRKRESALTSSSSFKNYQCKNDSQKRFLSLDARKNCHKNGIKKRKIANSLSSDLESENKQEYTSNQCIAIIPNTTETNLIPSSEINDQHYLGDDVSEKVLNVSTLERVTDINLQVAETSNILVSHTNEKSPFPSERNSPNTAHLARSTDCEKNENLHKICAQTFSNSSGLPDVFPNNEKHPRPHGKTNDGEEAVSFRVSCRVSGPHKTVLTVDWLTCQFVHHLNRAMANWTTNWREPVLDFYMNVTASHFIVGVSLAQKSLSLRRYIPHLTLRSTICYLMAKLSQISPGCVLLDPMCGGATILLEAATNFEVSHIIASDMSMDQLEVSRCNLNSVGIAVSLLLADATALPLHSESVDAIVCDLPFGQKHKYAVDITQLLRGVLLECQRTGCILPR